MYMLIELSLPGPRGNNSFWKLSAPESFALLWNFRSRKRKNLGMTSPGTDNGRLKAYFSCTGTARPHTQHIIYAFNGPFMHLHLYSREIETLELSDTFSCLPKMTYYVSNWTLNPTHSVTPETER